MSEAEFKRLKHADRIVVSTKGGQTEAEVFTLDGDDTIEYITMDNERRFKWCHYRDAELKS